MNLQVPDDAVRENEETPEMLNKRGGGAMQVWSYYMQRK